MLNPNFPQKVEVIMGSAANEPSQSTTVLSISSVGQRVSISSVGQRVS